ncbi:hypothetical protein Tco_0961123 [Tanacetum coccineum]
MLSIQEFEEPTTNSTICLKTNQKVDTTQKDHSNLIPALNVDSLKVDLVVIQNTCSEKEDSNSETASNKLVKECSLNSETKDGWNQLQRCHKSKKERCMAYIFDLSFHTSSSFKDDLKGTRIEHGFKRAFMSLFGQDVDTFTSTMLRSIDQLQKQLDKDKFQEDGSKAAFGVVNNQFQKFINLKLTLDMLGQMTESLFCCIHWTEVSTTSEIHYSNTLDAKESKIEWCKALEADLS